MSYNFRRDTRRRFWAVLTVECPNLHAFRTLICAGLVFAVLTGGWHRFQHRRDRAGRFPSSCGGAGYPRCVRPLVHLGGLGWALFLLVTPFSVILGASCITRARTLCGPHSPANRHAVMDLGRRTWYGRAPCSFLLAPCMPWCSGISFFSVLSAARSGWSLFQWPAAGLLARHRLGNRRNHNSVSFPCGEPHDILT